MRNAVIYGYCRVSTAKQKIQRQIDNIKAAYPGAVILTESYTGTKLDRPVFSKMLQKLRPGDTVVFDEVSRMSRNAAEGFELYKKLYDEGVELVFLKEPHINTDVYRSTAQAPLTGSEDLDETVIWGINEYLMRLAKKQIAIAFDQAQAEVDLLHMRTSEGVRKAQIAGKQIGRTAGTTAGAGFREYKKAAAARELIAKHNRDFGGTLTDSETIKLIGCARNSFYKYKKQLRQA